MSDVALISGASTGFGHATARLLATRGWKVIAVARRPEKLAALQADFPAQVLPLVLDVQDRVAIKQRLAGLPADFSAPDLLVNNAGLALGLEPAQRADLDDWQTMINTNCLGLVALTHAVLPGMIERGRGQIINIGSIAGSYPYPGGNVYGATKAFVHQFTLNLKADLIGTPLRVSCIEPGLASGSEFSQVRFKGDAVKAAQVYKGTEPIMADDIAEAVWWIISRPAHININTIEIMPTCQAPAGLSVARKH